YASHSHHVDSLRDLVLADLAGITPRAGTIPFYSSVSATPRAGETLDAAYWFENLRAPVRFADTVGALLHGHHRSFVEVSPHPVLALAVKDAVEAAGVTRAAVVGSLRRDHGSVGQLLRSLAELWAAGVSPTSPAALRLLEGRRVALPNYAFQRERYW